MSEAITKLLAWADCWPNGRLESKHGSVAATDIARDLRALLAERDALKADVAKKGNEIADLLNAQPTPRPAPSWKGVTYREGFFTKGGVLSRRTSEAVVACNWWIDMSTDADHAELLKLREHAERAVTVERVVREAYNGYDETDGEVSLTQFIANELYAAFGPFDAPRERVSNADELPYPVTAEFCISELVAMGAKRTVARYAVVDAGGESNAPVLILHTPTPERA